MKNRVGVYVSHLKETYIQLEFKFETKVLDIKTAGGNG